MKEKCPRGKVKWQRSQERINLYKGLILDDFTYSMQPPKRHSLLSKGVGAIRKTTHEVGYACMTKRESGKYHGTCPRCGHSGEKTPTWGLCTSSITEGCSFNALAKFKGRHARNTPCRRWSGKDGNVFLQIYLGFLRPNSLASTQQSKSELNLPTP